MSHTIYAGKIAKRKNSTLQPTLNTSFDVLLKSPTSLHRPTFTISAASFDYNYLKWGDRYYFVTDVVSRNNNLWEVSAICDVLATFKTDIIGSTQFVTYSSQSGGSWLPDTRIPVLKSTRTSRNSESLSSLFNPNGFYVVSVVGKTGCVLYAMDLFTIKNMLAAIQTWENDGVNSALNEIITAGASFSPPAHRQPSDDSLDTCFASLNDQLQRCFESIGDALVDAQYKISQAVSGAGSAGVLTGFVGNAYSVAPSCIRSCVWVPFFATPFVDTGEDLYLGNYPCLDGNGTQIRPFRLKADAVTGSKTIIIPWHYADWRRSVCEDVYLYLPMVGMIGLSADSLTNVTQLTIKYSATATDGVVCYEVIADNNIIGTYSGQCSANYPIGINQQASAGEIAQAIIGGIDKTVSAAITSNLSPLSIAGAVAGAAANAAIGAYDVANVKNSTHLTTVGGIGGGAGSGLDLDIQCFVVTHETVLSPTGMKNTMGVPTMQPMTLSGLTGYCQCANAHVAASGAEFEELSEIDAYLNSGFYIE